MTSTRQTTLPREDILEAINLRPPGPDDAAAMWRVARDSVTLDLNSPYAYLLWARDFAATSMVADLSGEVIGFVTGFRRPDAPEVLMVWQIAVDTRFRGHGLAGALLRALIRAASPQVLETTITDDNHASRALFASVARGLGANHEVTGLFTVEHFPDEEPSAAEHLHRIAPLHPSSH